MHATDFEDGFPTKVYKLPNTIIIIITTLITHSCWCPSTERNPCWYTLQAHFIPSHQLSKHSQNQGEWIPLLSIAAHMLYTPHSLSMYTHTPDPSISVKQLVDEFVCCFFSHHSLTSHTCCSSSSPFQQPSISSMQHKCKSAMYFSLSLSLSPSRPIFLSLSLTRTEFPRDHGHGPKCGTHEHVGESIATRSWSLG